MGAGSAGLGVCTAIKDGMVAAGLSEEAAMSRFVLCNHNGALGRKDGAHGTSHRTAQHHASAMIRCCDLICCHDAQQRCADDAVSSNANSVGCMHELMTRCCCWLAEPAAASNTATHMRGCLLLTNSFVWLTLPLLCPAPALPCSAVLCSALLCSV